MTSSFSLLNAVRPHVCSSQTATSAATAAAAAASRLSGHANQLVARGFATSSNAGSGGATATAPNNTATKAAENLKGPIVIRNGVPLGINRRSANSSLLGRRNLTTLTVGKLNPTGRISGEGTNSNAMLRGAAKNLRVSQEQQSSVGSSLGSTLRRHFSSDAAGAKTNVGVPGTRQEAAYVMGYTCGICGHQDRRKISKTAYHQGVVLLQCPSCKNRHLIADHLGWFGDERVTIEDILREKGEEIKKATLMARKGNADGSSGNTPSAENGNTPANLNPDESVMLPDGSLNPNFVYLEGHDLKFNIENEAGGKEEVVLEGLAGAGSSEELKPNNGGRPYSNNNQSVETTSTSYVPAVRSSSSSGGGEK